MFGVGDHVASARLTGFRRQLKLKDYPKFIIGTRLATVPLNNRGDMSQTKTEEFIQDGCRTSPLPSSQNLIYRRNSKSKISPKFSPSMSLSSLSHSSNSSLSTIEILKRTNNGMEDSDDDPLLFLDEDEIPRLSSSMSGIVGGSPSKDAPTKKTFDYEAYTDGRVMTPMQERCNAITMLPSMFYGMYFVLAGCWLTSEHIDMARRNGHAQDFDMSISGDWTMTALASSLFGGPHGFGVHTG